MTPCEQISVKFDMLNVKIFAARKSAGVDDLARWKLGWYASYHEVEVGCGGLVVAIALTDDTKTHRLTVGIALIVEMECRGDTFHSIRLLPSSTDLKGDV